MYVMKTVIYYLLIIDKITLHKQINKKFGLFEIINV